MVAEKAFRFVESVAMIINVPKDQITFLQAKDVARIRKDIIEWKEILEDA